jgi:hypothetical protein
MSNEDVKRMALTTPVATVWGTKEEVLQDDGHKVPKDNLSAY